MRTHHWGQAIHNDLGKRKNDTTSPISKLVIS